MKQFFVILLSYLILSPASTFAGTFYNPRPPKLKEKGSEAAQKLDSALADFYAMLESIEGNRIDMARASKSKFEQKMGQSVELFAEVHKLASPRVLEFAGLEPKQKKALDRLIQTLPKGKEITERDLTEIPLVRIGELISFSEAISLMEGDPGLFTKTRLLIDEVILVQRIGLDVSEIWEAAKVGNRTK
jgi:hypothetical protein